MARLIGLAVMVALCAAPASLYAQETGSTQQGYALAQEVCATCHAVERGEEYSPNLLAPTFERIAETPGMTATALSVALRTPHRTMPNLILKSDEISNITAYLLSLKNNP